MTPKSGPAPVRVLPEEVANKIAAGEVVERPSSVVKELVENALDAGATRVAVRVVGAGRRSIEVIDNGYGMGEQDCLLAVERHATSKIRNASDLDNVATLGFRGEALASIAAVSHFELVSRRRQDESATHIQIDGGILRDVSQVGASVGTRVAANRLYFNTPVRAKFLKGITTELSHCIDIVQRHALAHPGVAFQFTHNEKILLDIPQNASLRERIALIWGLTFVQEMIEIKGEQAGFTFSGFIGTPALTRSARSHQFFFLNGRPVTNRSLQYGFSDGYQSLLTIGRHPVGVVLVTTHPRYVDINIHPSKREVRFRDERAIRDAIRNTVRQSLEDLARREPEAAQTKPPAAATPHRRIEGRPEVAPVHGRGAISLDEIGPEDLVPVTQAYKGDAEAEGPEAVESVQTEFAIGGRGISKVAPEAVYRPVEKMEAETLQLFDAYLLVPAEDRLLIIDQHALHERLNYDILRAELEEADYEAQQLMVPILVDVPPALGKLLEANLDLFKKLGIEMEPFGGNTFQVTAACHMFDEAKIKDAIFSVLDELSQGNLFDREDFMSELMRLAMEACRSSVKAGDKLSGAEKQALLDGFRRLRPPYTCPHGRPIITELTLVQMEKSFRRRQ